MKKYILFNKINNQKYDVIFENGVKLGELIQDVHGYFYFFPESNGGFWESWVLRLICNKMDEINKPWDDEINKYFKENPQPRDIKFDEFNIKDSNFKLYGL